MLELFVLQKNLKFFLEKELDIFLVLSLFLFYLFIYLESASLALYPNSSDINCGGSESSNF
jgi:hypothetical protein